MKRRAPLSPAARLFSAPMGRSLTWGALVTATVAGFATLTGAPLPEAHGAPPAAAPAAPALPEPPQVGTVGEAINKLKCAPKGRSCPTAAGKVLEVYEWGLSRAKVEERTDKRGGLIFEKYDPMLARSQPGRVMEGINADRARDFDAFRGSFTPLLSSRPTALDNTFLHGEFSYDNKEAVQTLNVDGLARYFFYFVDISGTEKLWKVYDEEKLGEGSALGKTFQEAVTNVNILLAAPAAIWKADSSKGINGTTAVWQDAMSRLRLIDRGRGVVGIVLDERATLQRLSGLRTAQTNNPFEMDPAIKAATAGPVSDPNAQREGGAPPAKKKK